MNFDTHILCVLQFKKYKWMKILITTGIGEV